MLGGQSGLPPRPYDGRRGAFAGLTGLGKKPDSRLESALYYRISPAGLDPDYLRLRSSKGWTARLAGLAAFAGLAGLGKNPVSGLESEPYYRI